MLLKNLEGCTETISPFRRCPLIAAGHCMEGNFCGPNGYREPPCAGLDEDTDMGELCSKLDKGREEYIMSLKKAAEKAKQKASLKQYAKEERHAVSTYLKEDTSLEKKYEKTLELAQRSLDTAKMWMSIDPSVLCGLWHMPEDRLQQAIDDQQAAVDKLQKQRDALHEAAAAKRRSFLKDWRKAHPVILN